MMKNKIIPVIIIILVIVLAAVLYYIKNVMIVRDKDGMVYESQNVNTLNDENIREGDD